MVNSIPSRLLEAIYMSKSKHYKIGRKKCHMKPLIVRRNLLRFYELGEITQKMGPLFYDNRTQFVEVDPRVDPERYNIVGTYY
jgi:hypothetical protein